MEQNERPEAASNGPDRERTITAVERDAKQSRRYIIYADGEPVLNVHEDIMVKYRLLKGAVLFEEDIRAIVRADELQQAYVQALRYLERKPRTSKEIAVRLTQKGFEAELIEQVIRRLEDERFVDDALYAEQWTKQRVYGHKKGRIWVKHELQQKGVSKEEIAQAIEQLEPERELESAIQAGLKKWRQTKGSVKERKQKTAAYLLRRGYPGELAYRAIRTIAWQEPADPEGVVGDEGDDDDIPFGD